jgi:glycerophosphoryl diester phosphodiesterase
LAPENTIPSFRRALEIGVTTLELDVVISKEGVVVVSHEPWMARKKCRTPDGTRIGRGASKQHNIYEMTYDRIEEYDCGRLKLSDFPEQEPTSAPKPRLRDVVEMAESYVDEHDRPPVFYNVETKSRPAWDGTFQPDPETFARRVLAVIEEEGVAPRTTIQSFDPRTLEAVHDQNAVVRTALLIGWSGDEGLEENLATLSFQPDVYSPTARLVDGDRTVREAFEAYREDVAPEASLYMVDLASYGDLATPEGYEDVYNVSGWSEQVLEFIGYAEKPAQVIEEIDDFEPA